MVVAIVVLFVLDECLVGSGSSFGGSGLSSKSIIGSWMMFFGRAGEDICFGGFRGVVVRFVKNVHSRREVAVG